VFENIKTALNSVGGDFEHVVKITTYLTDIEQNADAYREVRASFFANRATLPASTLLQITRLANPSYLIEVEVMAVLPSRAQGVSAGARHWLSASRHASRAPCAGKHASLV
jgi:2-iminobutanoate/2-iminopropanoate deaminase